MQDSQGAAVLNEQDEVLLTPRNEVVGATEGELILRIGDRDEVAPWLVVTGISAARMKRDRNNDQWILVLAFELEMDGYEHVLLLTETEPAWVAITAALPSALPGIAPFEVWGVELLTASAPLELFQRPERLS
jgi:hypothetical protein